MPRTIQVIRRSKVTRAIGVGQLREYVQVMYTAPGVPPRAVQRDTEEYRDATAEELNENPGMTLRPLGPDALARELADIAADLDVGRRAAAETHELP